MISLHTSIFYLPSSFSSILRSAALVSIANGREIALSSGLCSEVMDFHMLGFNDWPIREVPDEHFVQQLCGEDTDEAHVFPLTE